MGLKLCKTKKLVDFRDNFCLKSYSNIEDQNLCISNTKESLDIDISDS